MVGARATVADLDEEAPVVLRQRSSERRLRAREQRRVDGRRERVDVGVRAEEPTRRVEAAKLVEPGEDARGIHGRHLRMVVRASER